VLVIVSSVAAGEGTEAVSVSSGAEGPSVLARQRKEKAI